MFVARRKYRDLTLLELDAQRTLVIACDSSGAIGPKPLDVVQVPGYVLGRFTARVPLMEAVAAGAIPVCVVNTLCVEPQPSGEAINQGVCDELRELGLDPDQLLTGSMEKNVPTAQSALGITVLGVAQKSELKIDKLRSGDSVAVLGVPKVGEEVFLDDPEIVDLPSVSELSQNTGVKELVPVGSRGIMAEAQDLAAIHGLHLELFPNLGGLDLNKSAGPSTCILVAGEGEIIEAACKLSGKPWVLLGRLTA